MRGFRLGGVAGDHFERLAQRVIASGCLLVPLLFCSGVGGFGLDARCCRCSCRLDVCAAVNSGYTGIDLSKAGVGDGRIGRGFCRLFSLRRRRLRLCDLVNPSFFCGEWGFVECGLFDLGI